MRPFCTLSLSFNLISRVSREEKRAYVLVRKWKRRKNDDRRKEERMNCPEIITNLKHTAYTQHDSGY